jgi:hypothetical protein
MSRGRQVVVLLRIATQGLNQQLKLLLMLLLRSLLHLLHRGLLQLPLFVLLRQHGFVLLRQHGLKDTDTPAEWLSDSLPRMTRPPGPCIRLHLLLLLLRLRLLSFLVKRLLVLLVQMEVLVVKLLTLADSANSQIRIPATFTHNSSQPRVPQPRHCCLSPP